MKGYAADGKTYESNMLLQSYGCQWESNTCADLFPNSLLNNRNFGLVQIESICRRQNKINYNDDFCHWFGWKHCGKRRKCIFSFSHNVFKKIFLLRVVKSQDWVVKSILFTKPQNFGLVQIESICRWKFRFSTNDTIFFDGEENSVGIEENVGYQHFYPVPAIIPKAYSVGSLEVGIVWHRVNSNQNYGWLLHKNIFLIIFFLICDI